MENIEVEYARKRGVQCFRAAEGNRTAVGEHALGMLLMLLNNLRRADQEVRQGIWLREENRGYELGWSYCGYCWLRPDGLSLCRKTGGTGSAGTCI